MSESPDIQCPAVVESCSPSGADGGGARLIHDMPAAEYHVRRVGAVTTGALKALHGRSPAHLRQWYDVGIDDSPALTLGRAIHAAALEPDVYAAGWVVEPAWDNLRTKAGRAERDAWRAEHAHLEVLTADAAETVAAVADAVLGHELAGPLLAMDGGQVETTTAWTDEATGLPCKARADLWLPSFSTLVDLKTTYDASPEGFARSCARYGYHLQAAHYSAGWRAAGHDVDGFVFIAVEKVPPYAVGVYVLDDESLDRGDVLRAEYMQTIARCVESGHWPGYEPRIQTIRLPRWAL